MKPTAFLHSCATFLILATGATLRAADDPAPPPGRPSREELREKFKGLTPEERQAKMEELRQKAGPGGLAGEEMQKRRAEFQKFRESVKDLPPAEREAKLLEWRQKNLSAPAGPGAMSAEERETHRKEFRKRVDEQISALNKKKADGTLSENETLRLQRMEEMAKRLESRSDSGGLGLPLPRPAGEKPAAPPAAPAKPVKPADAK